MPSEIREDHQLQTLDNLIYFLVGPWDYVSDPEILGVNTDVLVYRAIKNNTFVYLNKWEQFIKPFTYNILKHMGIL